MDHIIKKQVIDVTIQRGLDALAIQDRIKERFWLDLLPVIEAEFDKVASDGIDYKIEMLEIDLGNISEEMIESGEWAAVLKQQLSEKLKEIFSGSSGANWRFQKIFANIFDQWYYFLEHGYLPWNALRPSQQWFNQVLECLATEFESAERLRKLITEKEWIIQRIVLNHEKQFLTHLVELLTAQKQNELPQIIQVLSLWLNQVLTNEPQAKKITDRNIDQYLWIRAVRNACDRVTENNTKHLAKLLMDELISLSNKNIQRLPKLKALRFRHPTLQAAFTELLAVKETEQGTISDLKSKLAPNQKDSTRLPDQESGEVVNSDIDEPDGQLVVDSKVKEHVRNNVSKLKEDIQSQNSRAKKEMDDDGVYINHAGIVLLHPFLHTFFRKLELVREGNFIDLEKQQRAICLLHELAGTGEVAREYDIVLPKLLCSWPLQQPLNSSIEITEEEKNEVLNVLQAAVEQWEILKNASPAAMQQTFLQRGGKLFQRNGQWWLQVEPNSMDVLLDHLPWTISMIKLPWMKEVLRVDWR